MSAMTFGRLPDRCLSSEVGNFVNRSWSLVMTSTVTVFIGAFDIAIVNIALPHIAGALSATTEEATGILIAYIVANAIILPCAAWMVRLLGRRLLLKLAITGFIFSSVLCSLSPTLEVLVVCRILQGICNGPLHPISQAMILESVPPSDRGRALALFGTGVVLAPLMGPMIGGWIVEQYDWYWVFWVNVPIGILAIILNIFFAMGSTV